MCIFLQQSGEIRKPLIPAKYENFSGIFLRFYDYRLYLVKKYIFLYDMKDIFGVLDQFFGLPHNGSPESFISPFCW